MSATTRPSTSFVSALQSAARCIDSVSAVDERSRRVFGDPRFRRSTLHETVRTLSRDSDESSGLLDVAATLSKSSDQSHEVVLAASARFFRESVTAVRRVAPYVLRQKRAAQHRFQAVERHLL